MTYTIGNYIIDRLAGSGIGHYFVVPGDYNLVLLDKMLENKNVEQINCCNELNAAYAAEGYARVREAAALVVTYNVGAFSALNGIAGAYAERLPVIMISGSYNTNDPIEGRTPHHTMDVLDLDYQFDILQKVTCDAEQIRHVKDAPELIDKVIGNAIKEKKPGYIEVPCNIASAECPRPSPLSKIGPRPESDPQALRLAVQKVKGAICSAHFPVLLAGPRLRPCGAVEAFQGLAEVLQCPVAVQPNAKSFYPENDPKFIGVFWGETSTTGCKEMMARSDLIISVGPIYSDYSTVGWTSSLPDDRTINIGSSSVTLPGDEVTGVSMLDILTHLPGELALNDRTMMIAPSFRSAPTTERGEGNGHLTRTEMVHQIQEFLDPMTTIIAESGEAWFDTVFLDLPRGAGYEMELQYGSIGWSVPASFGYAIATGKGRRSLTVVGDGSFQLTAQEVANMIRYGLDNIIILINNRGYVSETLIHDGPYNYIKNWDYAGLMGAWNAGDGHGLGLRASTGRALAAALEMARNHRDGPVLIECMIDHEDSSPQLKKWGKRVAEANSRPPIEGP